jgi:lipopolysaccharide transport system ATP-binding protein
MNKKIDIKFENVSKEFNLRKHYTIKEFIPALLSGKQTHQKFIALENINFDISKGETIGIIGLNGSGKSTILKLIAGVMSPTKGKILVNGKVSPLIELGAGFHPELSGRENVYLNGSILGLKIKEIKNNFNNIVDFAEVWEFIDQPIKRYSSGMYVRLAFAIIVNVYPEILALDEILAVGDTDFQSKCFKRMEEFKKSGVTIIFVSHNIKQVENFCTRVIYIKNHQIIEDGKPEIVCQHYLKDINNPFNQ